ncbi:MAG: hypothetical protein MI923_18680 [Phycisphaerales bacterium]|nr:hypothetical protein [Phycisphaerales bacterium]
MSGTRFHNLHYARKTQNVQWRSSADGLPRRIARQLFINFISEAPC